MLFFLNHELGSLHLLKSFQWLFILFICIVFICSWMFMFMNWWIRIVGLHRNKSTYQARSGLRCFVFKLLVCKTNILLLKSSIAIPLPAITQLIQCVECMSWCIVCGVIHDMTCHCQDSWSWFDVVVNVHDLFIIGPRPCRTICLHF